MNKFIMSELADNEVFVLDVPVGHLRLHNHILRDGAGEMVFSIADGDAVPGRTFHDTYEHEALRIVCQTPEKARVLARAFNELANHMPAQSGK